MAQQMDPHTNLRRALQEQYLAALAMLADCVARCPDDLWTAGTPPRTFWRVALHAAYFAHLYLGQDVAAFRPYDGAPADYQDLWDPARDVEPYELPESVAPLSRRETRDYIAFVAGLVGPTLAALDLDAPETGFPWYPGMSKLSHELLSVRHLQGHVGQLSERLMPHGIDTAWVGKAGAEALP